MTVVPASPLVAHLRRWAGAWPPRPGLHVVGDPARELPTWDGVTRPLQGVGDGLGTVLAVRPSAVEAVRKVLDGRLPVSPGDAVEVGFRLGRILGVEGGVFGTGVFRWTHLPSSLPAVGTWCEPDDGRLPDWLAPFNGGRLVAWDQRGRYVAGIGTKIHDEVGQEIAVVTTREASGRGLARRLVVTAARRILADGGVPTYLHAPGNRASARVAEAAGFPDRGWRVHGLWGGRPV